MRLYPAHLYFKHFLALCDWFTVLWVMARLTSWLLGRHCLHLSVLPGAHSLLAYSLQSSAMLWFPLQLTFLHKWWDTSPKAWGFFFEQPKANHEDLLWWLWPEWVIHNNGKSENLTIILILCLKVCQQSFCRFLNQNQIQNSTEQ